MSYLITGASGQLGREWVQYAKQQGIPYRALSHQELDITDPAFVEMLLKKVKPKVLINCAAYTNVDGAETQKDLAFSVNRDGVANLVNASAKLGIKMVHYSTDYIFSGSSDDRIKFARGYPEDAPKDPVNVYGESKAAGESALSESGADYLLLRVSWLCGRFGSNFVKTMLGLGAKRKSLRVVDDQLSSPSFTDQVTEQTNRLLKKGAEGTYHLSSKGMISWADYATEIFNLSGFQINVERISSKEYGFEAERPKYSLLSTAKAESEGVEIIEWRSGLKSLLKQIGI
ncbi:MAG: dTDP-4-dehydrorhamnose reductase [Bacteroidetes bacterium]|jgi:dTDP-4-dehydrorhamnose reductase|nr:dTDP-4-dehydrorhamnose reductase [Bacteroidota bacterium]